MDKSGKGLFVDLDGTLADSLPGLRAAYHAFLSAYGVAGTEREFQSLNGPPMRHIVATLRDTHGLPGSHDQLAAAYAVHVRTANRAAPPTPGARQLLAHAGAEGWRIAVVTSAVRAMAQQWLARTDLARHVDVVVGGDCVRAGKPAAEPYSLALSRLGCDPGRSLAVEDSPGGATSAVAAGLPTWVVGAAGGGVAWPPGVRFIGQLEELVPLL